MIKKNVVSVPSFSLKWLSYTTCHIFIQMQKKCPIENIIFNLTFIWILTNVDGLGDASEQLFYL